MARPFRQTADRQVFDMRHGLNGSFFELFDRPSDLSLERVFEDVLKNHV